LGKRGHFSKVSKGIEGGIEMGKKIFALGICLLFFIAIASYVHAAGVTLAWDPPAEGEGGPVEGYMLCWGTSSGNYPSSKDVGNVLTDTLSGLDENETYYFVVKAYNGGGANIGPPSTPELEWAYSDTTPPSAPDGVSIE